jgi:hypothetical protein
MVVAWIIVLPILKGVKLDYGDPSIITGVIAGPVPGILGEETKGSTAAVVGGDTGLGRREEESQPIASAAADADDVAISRYVEGEGGGEAGHLTTSSVP